MSSGTGPIDLDRWLGVHGGMIVAKAADLTVPRPTKFVTNLHVARTLRLDVPPRLSFADEVIE